MSSNPLVLADFVDYLKLPWYSWLCLAGLVIVLIIYKIQKNKMV